MVLYTEAPPMRPFSDDKPTLIVMWWSTTFCTAIILLRLAGRYIRVEKLFAEDCIAAAALIPLYLRAICVHFVLRYGTNNVNLNGLDLTDNQLNRRIIGSKLVLASRVFDAATLWTLKFATMEFFGRLAGATRRKSHARMILFMRYFLAITFIAVIVSNLAECQPFPAYWQVTPDPGGQCRQGFVQLLTMASCNATTDVFLIAFPIPIILQSRIPLKRKILLVLLFSLGLVTVIITAYRVPQILKDQGSQVVRTMWASAELLTAVCIGNTVALGSFLRDSGIKRPKFKPESSGMSNSQHTRVTKTTVSNWENEAGDDSEDSKSKTSQDGGIWATRVPQGIGEYSSRIDADRSGRVSPTQSHDSLITRDQLSTTLTSTSTHKYERPARVVTAGTKGVHRGSTIRPNAMD